MGSGLPSLTKDRVDLPFPMRTNSIGSLRTTYGIPFGIGSPDGLQALQYVSKKDKSLFWLTYPRNPAPDKGLPAGEPRILSAFSL